MLTNTISIKSNISNSQKEEVVNLMYDTFKSKFLPILKSEETVKKLLIESLNPNSIIYATKNNCILGILAYQTKEVPFLEITYDIAKETIQKNLFKKLFLLSFLDHKAKKDECYIEMLAVSSKARNKGIGKSLLAHLYMTSNKPSITLNVIEGNRAKNLYVKEGFKVIKKTSTFPIRLFTGYTFKHLFFMKKEM